jgi:hypothetical protein
MNEIDNPYCPGAGTRPYELVGRESVIERFRVLLGRIKASRPEKSILMTGLRGVGKTVLLNEAECMAENAGYRSFLVEAREDISLAALLVPPLRKVLYGLSRSANASHKLKAGWNVAKSLMDGLSFKVGELDVSVGKQSKASADLTDELPELFVAVAGAAAEQGKPIAILLDEIQYLDPAELGALAMAMHKMQQKRLPLALIGAGLPTLQAIVGNAKSYAERLFAYEPVGALSEADCLRALSNPAKASGVEFEPAALKEIYALTQGYPYFVQEWGLQSWNMAGPSTITAGDVRTATPLVIRKLDDGFFGVRFDRLMPSEKSFLRAMAGLGSGAQSTSAITAALGRASTKSIGPLRGGLLKKGMVYAPAHGQLAFTVPLFDEFMKRAMP